jgi:regulator of replication initiation timing
MIEEHPSGGHSKSGEYRENTLAAPCMLEHEQPFLQLENQELDSRLACSVLYEMIEEHPSGGHGKSGEYRENTLAAPCMLEHEQPFLQLENQALDSRLACSVL